MNPSEEISNAVQAVLNRPRPFMRVFEIDYVCGLCQGRHTAEPYFFNDTRDLEALHADTMESLRDNKTMLTILMGDATVHHHDKGDLKELMTRSEASGKDRVYQVIQVTMTSENKFICDECGRDFPSLPIRLMHMGRHPRNGHRIGNYECKPR